jgi:hypothetical protein
MVVLHYKVTPACITWNIFAFYGAITELEAIKSFGSLLENFPSLLHPSDIPVRKLKTFAFQERYTGNIHCSLIQCPALPCPALPCPVLPCHCSCKRILPFLWLHTNAFNVAEIQSAFSFLSVHSEFECRSFILSYNGSESLFGRWWNLKTVEMQDMWRGTVLCRVLQGVLHKGEIQLHVAGVKPVYTSSK